MKFYNNLTFFFLKRKLLHIIGVIGTATVIQNKSAMRDNTREMLPYTHYYQIVKNLSLKEDLMNNIEMQ